MTIMKYVELNPMNEPASQAELLSALHDGQLDAASAAALVRASLTDASLMQQWRSMSAVSAALGQASALPALPLASVAPRDVALPLPAANDGVFRWKMLAGFAACAALGSLVWGLVGQQAAPSGAQLAQQTPAPATASALASAAAPAQQNLVTVQASAGGSQEPLVMIRDPRLDELLAAHKQFGGMSALQQPAGSLRSVSLNSTRP
jgi:sigma-E factor negative regulatory protein RseA